MERLMSETDCALFLKYISSRNDLFYYEFGSGWSTVVACQHPRIMSIWTVESDVAYYESMRRDPFIMDSIHTRKLNYTLVDLKCTHTTWGSPGFDTSPFDWDPYYRHIHGVNYMPDIVFIDGPFRVACALHTYVAIDESRFVLFNDFVSRPEYHSILKYFRIIELGEKLAVLQKREGLCVDLHELALYESDAR